MHSIRIIGSTFASGLLLSTSIASAQQVLVSSDMSATYTADSQAQRQVREWLQAHAIDGQGNLLGDFPKIGNVKATYHAAPRASTGSVPVKPGLPVPLVSAAQEGDRYTVSTCRGGIRQSWSIAWHGKATGQDGWELQAYDLDKSKPC